MGVARDTGGARFLVVHGYYVIDSMPKSGFNLRQKVFYAEFRSICQTGAAPGFAGVLLRVQPKGNIYKALSCTVRSLNFFPTPTPL